MKKYYKILGLKPGATLDEVEEKYIELLKEFDPKKQSEDLKEFFTSERQKVKEAYKEISASLINTDSVEQKIDSDTNEIDSENQDLEESLADEIVSDEVTVDYDVFVDAISDVLNKKESHVFRNVLLLFIASGIWGMFLQNMGLFVPSDEYAQNVRVVNTVDTNVSNSVDVYGSVSVDNTVGIDIKAINGHYNAFWDSGSKHSGEYYRLPVYTY